ncbi:MAG: hypothetical protein HY668_00900 [Chloroflexi bacterium]|nr:hypothetical protein [Chloroflexota bacterium]
MKIYNSYILTVALLLLLTTLLLMALGQDSLDLYYTLYVVEALAVTELYVHFNTKARHGLTRVSFILFIGFAVIMGSLVIRVLA